jgi:ribosome maturation factor RimP
MAFELDRVREIAERVAASSGLEVVEVELRGGGKARMLRVFLDKPWAGCRRSVCGGSDARRLRQLQPRVWHDSRC